MAWWEGSGARAAARAHQVGLKGGAYVLPICGLAAVQAAGKGTPNNDIRFKSCVWAGSFEPYQPFLYSDPQCRRAHTQGPQGLKSQEDKKHKCNFKSHVKRTGPTNLFYLAAAGAAGAVLSED